jgi:3'(2'), 5'-bisphosphate nucleotidase
VREAQVVDPLDGTREYIAKTGHFAVMIGLTRHHQPVLGMTVLLKHGTPALETKMST